MQLCRFVTHVLQALNSLKTIVHMSGITSVRTVTTATRAGSSTNELNTTAGRCSEQSASTPNYYTR
jgi:hypothetical protein